MKKLLSVLSVFALAAIAAGTASAGSINTPTGLNPGDNFRIVFVTSTLTAATSGDLATYDSFVSADATGTTYDGIPVLWQAIVSNYTIHARDHIGLQSTSTTPLYTVDGTLVSAGNIWSGALLAPISKTINNTQLIAEVWTGTNPEGGSARGFYQEMGSALYGGNVRKGNSGSTNGSWLEGSSGQSATLKGIYGISGVLTVPSTVPEPSTAMLAGLGGLAALVYSFKRKRNSCQR